MKLCNLLFVLFGLTRAVAHSGSSKLRRQVSQLRDGGYDFIIAGGGTSGLTVANRLSESFPNSESSSQNYLTVTPF